MTAPTLSPTIARIVAQAPPLTQSQRAALVTLLWGQR